MSSGFMLSSASSPPCGMENGLWEKSIFSSSSFHSYMGKSTTQQNSKRSAAMRPSSEPSLVRARPAKSTNSLGMPATKKTASPPLKPRCSRIALVRTGPRLLAIGAARRLLEADIAHATLAFRDRPGVHAVAEGARASARHRDRPDTRVCVHVDHAGEQFEAGAAEVLGRVLHLDRVAQVRLVGAVFAQRIGVSDARKLLRHRLVAAEFLEQPAYDRLDRVEYVFLRDEAHFQNELVELPRRTIGAGILVAEAGRDLEVPIEAGDHDQLLELLRRLRQRVEFSRMHAARHEIVTRPLRRGGGEDRGLKLEEAGLAHAVPQRPDDRLPLHDVGVQVLAAEIEEAVFEPRLLRIVGLAKHRQRQLLRLRQHLDRLGPYFNLSRRQSWIDGFG